MQKNKWVAIANTSQELHTAGLPVMRISFTQINRLNINCMVKLFTLAPQHDLPLSLLKSLYNYLKLLVVFTFFQKKGRAGMIKKGTFVRQKGALVR